MRERALALDEEQLSPRAAPSTTSRSAAPAMKSATTASTAMPQPAIAMPVWPVGTNCDFRPRRCASRSSSIATVFFPIAQSEPTVRHDLGRELEVLAGRDVEVRPAACAGRAARRRGALRQLDELGIVGDELVQPALDVEPGCDRVPSGARARPAGSVRPAVATPTSAVVGSNGSASATVPTTGIPSWLSPAPLESRIATVGSGA